MKYKLASLIWLMGMLALQTGCSESTNSGTSPQLQSEEAILHDTPNSHIMSKASRLNVDLKKNRLDAYSNVTLNIQHIELWMSKGSKKARLVVGENLGPVNFLDSQAASTLLLSKLEVPEGVQVSKVRVILEKSGHFAIRSDGSTCSLKTPSAQKSGIKINLATPVKMENGMKYSLSIAFDAKKSIVQLGNGGCLLKPAFKVPRCQSSPISQDDDDTNEEIDEGTNGEDDSDSSDTGDSSDDSNEDSGQDDSSSDDPNDGSGDSAADGITGGDPSPTPGTDGTAGNEELPDPIYEEGFGGYF